jgi:hypothetical protein
LKELKLLLQRALAKFKGFHAHERRAAHEAKVMEMLLKELDDMACIVIADWKVQSSAVTNHTTDTGHRHCNYKAPHYPYGPCVLLLVRR